MKNNWIYNKVNKLVKKYGTRNPEELAKQMNIAIKYISAPKTLLGIYKVIEKK